MNVMMCSVNAFMLLGCRSRHRQRLQGPSRLQVAYCMLQASAFAGHQRRMGTRMLHRTVQPPPPLHPLKLSHSSMLRGTLRAPWPAPCLLPLLSEWSS